MDNRLIFLYCSITELWGHVRRAGAGNGKSGTSEVVAQQANPLCIRRSRDVERNLVAKPVSHASRKAAIVYTVPVP